MRGLVIGLLTLLSVAKAQADDHGSFVVQAEEQTRRLGEFIRHDVESVSIINDGVMEVQLTNGNLDKRPTALGVLVPFAVQGRGGGNLFQEYVALYEITHPDQQLLDDMNAPKNARKDAVLLSFAQIDGGRWGYVDWSRKKVIAGMISIPACEDSIQIDKCEPHHRGSVIITVDGNTFGPNITLTYFPP